MVVEPEKEKEKRKESIQNLFAFDMFCQKRFDDSLQLFAQLETGGWTHQNFKRKMPSCFILSVLSFSIQLYLNMNDL